eukprot:7371538-Prymnesium_polylepis.1
MVSLPSHLPACRLWMSVSYEVFIYTMFQPYMYISCGVIGAKMENSRERNELFASASWEIEKGNLLRNPGKSCEALP